MKRSRNNGSATKAQKSLIGPSRGRSVRQSEAVKRGSSGKGARRGRGGGRKAPTFDDAYKFLKTLGDTFVEQREKYDMFVHLMGDYRFERIDRDGLKAKVTELFEGHPELMIGFNVFLPKGHEIILTDKENNPPKTPVSYQDAIAFIWKSKERLGGDSYVYNSFLDLLNNNNNNITVSEIYQDVAILFKEHPDLVEEFKRLVGADAIPTSGDSVTSATSGHSVTSE